MLKRISLKVQYAFLHLFFLICQKEELNLFVLILEDLVTNAVGILNNFHFAMLCQLFSDSVLPPEAKSAPFERDFCPSYYSIYLLYSALKAFQVTAAESILPTNHQLYLFLISDFVVFFWFIFFLPKWSDMVVGRSIEREKEIMERQTAGNIQ